MVRYRRRRHLSGPWECHYLPKILPSLPLYEVLNESSLLFNWQNVALKSDLYLTPVCFIPQLP